MFIADDFRKIQDFYRLKTLPRPRKYPAWPKIEHKVECIYPLALTTQANALILNILDVQ